MAINTVISKVVFDDYTRDEKYQYSHQDLSLPCNYKFSSANEAKRLRTTPFKFIVALPGKFLKRSTI
jgi:hypothetical protein